MGRTMTFNEFLNNFKEDALNLDLEKQNNRFYSKLQEQQTKLTSADLDSERSEVKEFAENGIKHFKGRLIPFWKREKLNLTNLNDFDTREKYIKSTYFIVDLRGYFECKDLYDEAIKSLETNLLTEKKELTDFLCNEKYQDKLQEIVEKFKNAKGKEMATVIYLMDSMGILKYEYGSKTKGRKQLAELFNPKVKMQGINKYFEPNTSRTTIPDNDMKTLQEWFSGL